MARAAISSASQASLSAFPVASRAAVREQSWRMAARMMTSGNGTRSAAPMIVETKLMWPLPSAENGLLRLVYPAISASFE